MKRFRWFAAEWPFSIRILANRLKSNAFSNELSDGFVLDRVREDFLQARFVERFEYEQKVVDPFGQEISIHRVDFKQSEFRASLQSPGLEFVDASRSAQSVVSRLAQISEFSLAVNAISIDVLSWSAEFQRQLEARAKVLSLQLSSLALDTGVVAKVLIRGDDDVLEASKALTRGRNHVVEKVQLAFGSGNRLRVTLTNTGAAGVDGDASDDVLNALRKSISVTLG